MAQPSREIDAAVTVVSTYEESAVDRRGRASVPERLPVGLGDSSYQIEGAATVDGRGESIWDRFCTDPGSDHGRHRRRRGVRPLPPCRRRHRADAAPQPQRLPVLHRLAAGRAARARGQVNARGLDFYDRLVDSLLAAGIQPFPTLYHWDLPQVLEDQGGWPVRATAEAFADYAEVVADALGDRVTDWMTLNEPFVVANHGYLTGEHAPGRNSLRRQPGHQPSPPRRPRHGDGADPRSGRPAPTSASCLNFTPVTPIGSSPAALDRQRIVDDIENRWYVDPIGGLGYPRVHRRAARLGAGRGPRRRHGADRPADRHARRQLLHPPDGRRARRRARRPWRRDRDGVGDAPAGARRPAARAARRRTSFPRYLITENGAAMPDSDVVDGRVIDHDRLEYIAAHLGQVHQAMEDGVPVEGYFAWSLLDNFEWAPRLRAEVRPRRGRHGDPAPHAQAERPVVRRGRQVRRDPPRPRPQP